MEQRVLESLAALPGVKAAGATNDVILRAMALTVMRSSGHVEKPEDGLDVELPWVSDNYHQTLGIPLIAGCYFAASDKATATKVVIVNEKFARHHLQDSARGARIYGQSPYYPETSVIVGVVADALKAAKATTTPVRPMREGYLSPNIYAATWSARSRLRRVFAEPSRHFTASSS